MKVFYTVLAILFTVVFLAFGVATDSDETKQTLYKSGFTNPNPGDVVLLGCSEGDKLGREFTATNAQGQTVSGVVCCGIFKSCTVRF